MLYAQCSVLHAQCSVLGAQCSGLHSLALPRGGCEGAIWVFPPICVDCYCGRVSPPLSETAGQAGPAENVVFGRGFK